MLSVPRAYPKEFRDDVVAVARKGDASIAVATFSTPAPN